jgi:hypothetical protein
MDIAKGIQKFVVLLMKTYAVLLVFCIGMQILGCWWSTVHLSAGELCRIWLVLAAASVIAYFVRRNRSLPRNPGLSHAKHGAERTPQMPRRGRQA